MKRIATRRTTLRPPTLSASLVAKLSRLSDAASRARFVASHPRLIHPALVQQLAETVSRHVNVNPHEALALSEAALLFARRVGDDDSLALALRAKANACWFLHENKSAADLYGQAERLFEATGNQTELGRTLSSSINSLNRLGEYAQALAAGERARAIFTALGDERRLARVDVNIANVLHRQDRLVEALETWERAYERLLPFQDAEAIGVMLHNIALCLIVLNDFERALATYNRARAHAERARMPVLVAQADYNIAYLYFFRGEYSRALDMLRSTRIASRKAGDSYHGALCILDQSDIYLELNLSAEAADIAQQAQREFERLGMGYEAARSVTNLAVALGQQGEAFRALELFVDARGRFEREQNVAWPLVIDLYQALVLHNEGRYFEARRLCASALEGFRASGLQRKAIFCELLLARIALRTEQPSAALARCDEAIAHLASVEAPVLEYQALLLKGQILEAARDRSGAYRAYQSARARLEALRNILWGEDLKIAFMQTKLEVYERLVALCLEEGRPVGETFEYMEQAKSRSLRDQFFERVHQMPAPDPGQSALVRRIRTLRQELNWYYHRVELEQLNRDDRSAERLDRLQQELREREQTFITVLRDLPAAERAGAGVHSTAVADPDEIREALEPGATLVEYFMTGDRIIAAVLSRDRLEVAPVTTGARVRQILRMLQFQFSKFQFGPEYAARVNHRLLEATQAHLQGLYGELLAPLRLTPGAPLVIVPHDLLHHVPFHALHDGDAYVIDRSPVGYAPSASIYALCHRRVAASLGSSLILGVPDARAPFILDEVHAVAATLPDPRLRIGDRATAEVLRQEGPASRTVHIATHGYFRQDNPLFSGVRLGDAFLTLHDLYDLNLPVDLITLSGCGTGLQVVAAGDELRGLVRGLLAAGARSLLVTLWDVHDRSTAEFMKAFYEALARGLTKAAAVQQATADVRERYPHPYYWGPFVLVGGW